jgi:hypothetical protein
LFDELTSKVIRVDQIPVVRNRGMSESDVGNERLHVRQTIATRCGITNVTYGDPTGELGEIEIAKYLSDETKPLMNEKVRQVIPISVNRHNAGALLPSVLLSVEPEVGEVRGFRMVPYRHQTALVVKFIRRKHTIMTQRYDRGL